MGAFVPSGRILNAMLTFSMLVAIASAHKVLLFLASSAKACFREFYTKLMVSLYTFGLPFSDSGHYLITFIEHMLNP